MECGRPLVFSLMLLLMIPMSAHAQAWSGIIDPSRAIDWSNAGIPGGIPNRTTQCGSTTPAYTGTAATINAAIAACPAGDFVSLGAGTFNLSNGIDFANHSNVTLRGQGADSTFIVFTGDTSCFGLAADVCMESKDNSYPGGFQNTANWTAGFAVGTTSITVSNTTGMVAGQTILILDQCDEGTSGATCTTGTDTDTGTIWNCYVTNVCSNGASGGTPNNRSQMQLVLVTAFNPGTGVLTISPGLYMANWASARTPQAHWSNSTLMNAGLENVSLDHTGSAGALGVVLDTCYQCWVSGIRSIDPGRDHIDLYQAIHSVVQNSYFYQGQAHASQSYGVENFFGSDNLIQNNVFQQVTNPLIATGPDEGNVWSYNFSINDLYSANGWMQPSNSLHSSGTAFDLHEGNIGPGFIADNVHGTHQFTTLFRNWFAGNQSLCNGVPCTNQTVAVQIYAASRYFNVIGNVLGQTAYHNNYTCAGASSACANGNTSIYTLGFTGNGGSVNATINRFCLGIPCTSHGDYDPQTTGYLFRWGNYDTVDSAVQWNSAEVPSQLPSFANAVPGTHLLPASFYLSAKPSWWGTMPYPAVGPDVTGGPGPGGFAYANPAQTCYATTMGGPADGTGSALRFNANACYGQQNPPPNLSPATNLAGIAH